jgi:ABC-2 type transport system permease protein
MKQFYAIFKKEILGYFNSPLAYIFTAIFLIVGNWLFFQSFFLYNQASMRGYFDLLPWIFLFITPALTMRLWAEEKKSGTIEVLLTFPVKDIIVVLAKFFSSLAFLALVLLLSISIPITTAFLGDLDIGVIIGGYLGSLFLGAIYLSIGLFLSSLTKNQIVAFLLAVVACFLLFLLSSPFVLQAVTWLAPVLKVIGSASHFQNLSRGLLDTRDILYFISVTALFLFLNRQVLASRNWKS